MPAPAERRRARHELARRRRHPARAARRPGAAGPRRTVVLDFPPDGGPPSITSGREGYDAGHIPGAAFADLITELSDPTSGLPFTVPSAERFARAIGELGVGDGTHVVVYDQGETSWATRLWWLLRYFGFEDVQVLDGGLPAWTATGGELEPGAATYEPGAFTARPRPELLATRDDVLAAMEDGATCIVNALDEAWFRSGRIPGSAHLAARGLLDPSTGRMLPVEELRRAIGEVVPEAARRRSPTAAAGSPRARRVRAHAGGTCRREAVRRLDDRVDI